MENDHAPHEADAVLSKERVHFPVDVANWILNEPGDVLESPPALGLVPRLLGAVDELTKVTIGVLGQSSEQNEKMNGVSNYLPADHISALIDVRNAVEEALDASQPLAHV